MSSLPSYSSIEDKDHSSSIREDGKEEEGERRHSSSSSQYHQIRSPTMSFDKNKSTDSESRRTIQERRRSKRQSRIEEDLNDSAPLDPQKHPFSEMFGFMPFHKLGRLKNDPSVFGSVRKAEPPKKKKITSSWIVTLKNVIWVLLFGWWMSLLYFTVGLFLMLTFFGIQHGKVCWEISSYFLWPFGKYVVRIQRSDRYHLLSQNGSQSPNDQSSLPNSPPSQREEYSHENESRWRFWIGQIIWIIIAVPPLLIFHSISFILNWMPIIYIPMAKVHREMIKLLFRSPRSIRITSEYPGPAARLLLGTFEASNLRYFRYVVSGVNVCLINLIPFIVLTVALGKAPEEHRPPPIFMFFTSLLSIIPTAYFIGLAVSSISAQSNFAVGALLNATFGSVVEIILYTATIVFGQELDDLVIASVTGALLSTLLLIPGLSMIFGGIRHKEQYFNVSAAGVSNILLIISVIGVFTPTIFYASYRKTPLDCMNCIEGINGTLSCGSCVLYDITPKQILADKQAFLNGAKPLIYAISFVLPLAYIIGLIFTLKTHSYLYEKPIYPEGVEAPEGGHGEDAPEWPKWKALLILLIATGSFALVSEELVDAAQEALKSLNLSQQFVGVFFVGLASSSAEIVNAVNFALNNNIALSIEIGAAGTIQAILIQIPALVLISAVTSKPFVIIFPLMNVFAIGSSVIINNYLSINGKSNYFEGASLVLIYIVFVLAFFFVPS